MKAKIVIKLKEAKDGSLISTVKGIGNPDMIINGLLDALYTICEDNNVDLKDVSKTLLHFDKQYVGKND